MNRKKKQCAAFAMQICERLGEDFDSPRCAAIRTHLAECEDCSRYLRGLEKVVSLYRAYPVPPLPAEIRKKVRRSLKTQL